MDDKTRALRKPDGSFLRGSVVFYHDNSPYDIAIRLGEDGYFSHVAVATGDGKAICAEFGRGVIGDTADFQQLQDVEARMFPGDVEQLIGNLSAQMGKPYDFPVGLLAGLAWRWFGIRFGGGPPAAFDCSSLVAWGWAQQGRAWSKPLRAVTPQDLWNALGA